MSKSFAFAMSLAFPMALAFPVLDLVPLRYNASCGVVAGPPSFDKYCTSNSQRSTSCDSGCATSPRSPMVLCCASSCCGAGPPPGPSPPSPPSPGPSPSASCPDDDEACYSTPGCGYCIDEKFNSGCYAGDHAGPFKLPSGQGNCTKQWTPGVYRTPASMCVMVISKDDTRCYKQCTYGQGIGETFVVPGQKACDAYDSAFKSTCADPVTRKKVHEHIAAYLLQKAIGKAAVLSAQTALNGTTRDLTRQLIAHGLVSLENDGLQALETVRFLHAPEWLLSEYQCPCHRECCCAAAWSPATPPSPH